MTSHNKITNKLDKIKNKLIYYNRLINSNMNKNYNIHAKTNDTHREIK